MAIRLKRDSQQWVFDRTIQESGKVFHFQGPGRGFLPPSVHQHDMIAKHMGREGFKLRELAIQEETAGHRATALELYFDAANVLAQAQHTIFETDDEKRLLHGLSIRCFDRVRELAPYPIERIEIPWEDRQVYGNLHLLPDSRQAPCLIVIPGCDMTKEMYPHPLGNHAGQRGMHLLTLDGPGQGECNIDGTKLTADNYERAVSAAVDYLLTRPEVDPEAIAVLGVSFGSFWSFRAAAHDSRFRAHVSTWASICDKHHLMNVESPRYKQLFAYLTGAESEDDLDAIVARMTNSQDAPRIQSPSLLTVGEYDPRSPLSEVQGIYDRMTCERELWVFENQHHMCTLAGHAMFSDKGIWNHDSYWLALDWISDRLGGVPVRNSGEVTFLRGDGIGPHDARALLARDWLGTVSEEVRDETHEAPAK